MSILDRLLRRERELLCTNGLGAQLLYPVGAIAVIDSQRWPHHPTPNHPHNPLVHDPRLRSPGVSEAAT